ncbi:MAG: SIMPL domain-containing protein [Actinobacteria bacterium]|nr:SIMPL domain-containing protein [Actinomycetota bacterium]MCA1720008.1 SIMPL domain-containing protein [Actinomycetota bacterium]
MRRTALLAVPLAVIVSAAVTVGAVHSPGPAVADAGDPAEQGVVVGGLGKVSGTPDVLRLQLGVEVRRADVSQALRDANAVQARVRKAVRDAGVADKDVQTSEVSLYPAYDSKGKPNGYVVSESMTVKLRDLARAGKTIGEAVEAGGNAARVQGVSFALEDNAALLEKARDAAYADARRKAERYAQLAGRPLGQVELVSEQVPEGPQSMPYAARLASAPAADMAAVPLDAGQSQVSVSVTVRWSLR